MRPLGSLLQVVFDLAELLEGGFEVVDDLTGDDIGGREIGGIFKGVVLQPEDVEVHLVALEEVLVGEAPEALGLDAALPVPVGARTCRARFPKYSARNIQPPFGFVHWIYCMLPLRSA
jgi:hypothetical protein